MLLVEGFAPRFFMSVVYSDLIGIALLVSTVICEGGSPFATRSFHISAISRVPDGR